MIMRSAQPRAGLAAAIVALVLAMATGCGGGDGNGDGDGGDGNERPGSAGDVRNGTWLVMSQVRSHPGNEVCDLNDTTQAADEMCNLESQFEEEFGRLGGSIACSFQIQGNQYTVSCSGDTTIQFCNVHVRLDGGGIFSDTTYTFQATAIMSVSPAICEVVPPCTLDVNEQGAWIDSTAGCTDDTTAVAAGSSPVRRAFDTILGAR